VALPLELDGVGLAAARRHGEIALGQVGLGAMTDRYPDELSGGEQQRVAIARGIVGPRTLLLADEPTGALDDLTSESILKIIRARCDDGAAAIMVTHEPSFAAWADRVVRLRDGRIESVTEGSSIPANLAELLA
jgi:putative ABC transport system ATP-binding protein